MGPNQGNNVRPLSTQLNHLTSTPKIPDDGGPNIGAIVAGVMVPLIVIGIGLLVLYIWYRRKYPVRMVFGKDFGKFTNPLYDKRPSTLSLVREDAHKFWEGNEGLDGPASESDVDKEANVFMEVSGQDRCKSPSGISLVVEDWRAVEPDNFSGIKTEEIPKSTTQRKLSHEGDDISALDQSDTRKVRKKKKIHVDKSLFEGLSRQDSTETKDITNDDPIPLESTENNIAYQQSVEIDQTFADAFEKSNNPINSDETVLPESTANKTGSQQSTSIMENVAETLENEVIKLKHFEENPQVSEEEENIIVEEKEKHNSDTYVEDEIHRHDTAVEVVNIQKETNEPTESVNISTNMEVDNQTDPSIKLLIDDTEPLESTQTDKELVFGEDSPPEEEQNDVYFAETSVHLSGGQFLQDEQVMLKILDSEQGSDHDEEQLHKQLYNKDLTLASVAYVHQLRTPKDELALTDLCAENKEDIDDSTAEITEQETDYDTVENKEAPSTHSFQNETELDNPVKNTNQIHETHQFSDMYEQQNKNIQQVAESSHGEYTLDNIYSQKAEFTPQDASVDQEEKVGPDSNAFSTSESGSSDSSFDDTHDGSSSEKKDTPSLDAKFNINSSDVPTEERSPFLSFGKSERINIATDVSGGKFAQEQFQNFDSVVMETDTFDILDKDGEQIESSQSIAKGFNDESSFHEANDRDLDNTNSSNLNNKSDKPYKTVDNADPNTSEQSISNNLKVITVSFKDFDISSSDSDDESSDNSDDKPVENTPKTT